MGKYIHTCDSVLIYQKREVNEVNVVQVIACAHGTICVCAMRMSVCAEKNAHSTVDLWSFEFLPGTFYRAMDQAKNYHCAAKKVLRWGF